MIGLVYVLAFAVLVSTALPVLRADAWWIRIFDFPRLQIVTAAVVAIIGFIVLGADSLLDSLVMSALALSIGLHGYRILPFTPVWRKQVTSAGEIIAGPRVSVLVANVLMDNRNSDGLFSLVDQHDPDIILTLEIDGWWATKLRRYEASHPHSLFHPLQTTYGIAIQSRIPAEVLSVRHLVSDEIPSILARFVLAPGKTCQFYGLHPRPPHPEQAETTARRDAELLIVGKEVAQLDGPVIVAGDLNDVAWSHTTRLFQRISRLVDPRRGRGMFNTFHADRWYARWPLDHIFHTEDFHLISIERLPAFGSDHFPVLARLQLSEVASGVILPAGPFSSDHAEMRRTIDKALNDT